MKIIQDTREQEPWVFEHYDFCSGQIAKKLDEGDYTIDGYPDLICIERKKGSAELANNLGIYYKRFLAEMERIQKYRFRYVICEFSMETLLKFPLGSGIPKHRWSRLRITGRYMLKKINDLICMYEVEFIFCENREEAREKAAELMIEAKKIYDAENR